MKIYQCIHKYPPHIPQFESKYGINDNSNISFEELRNLIVEDGYASSYILQPALDGNSDEVFYTLWNYERLQFLWARENNVDTRDLDEIKLAQLKLFKPDVFYNMSPLYDNNFIELVKLAGIDCKTVCWNAIVQARPKTYSLYDVHLTLHKPYVKYWRNLGLDAFELQPGIPDDWKYKNEAREIDVLFYGQYSEAFFTRRNRLVESLIELKKTAKYKTEIYLQYQEKRVALIHIPKFAFRVITYPARKIRKAANKPIYGGRLYSAIGNSKIVVNAYGDDNQDFKSNMRIFEAIGHGAFLISERGNYPDGLEPDIDFYTYDGFDELKQKIKHVLANWEKHRVMAHNTAKKVRKAFSKEKQWHRFQEIVDSI